ncbi:ZrgA family zinc uptake protein [Chitinilyticum litopenaei]|uniref:ZrgA family zinc uptake protein n=1 Tax=Chitinilyticum litopenaei TaxID=1121276 RepID=UPI000401EBFA|nr:DUF2796 domain-containing protein [Chitinilyticum litopenaei]
MKPFILIACIAISSQVYAGKPHQHAAHQHGVATLDVASDGTTLHIALDSPADNLLGFEHAPKTPAQKAELEQLGKQLARATTLLDIPAGCTASAGQVALPAFGKGEHSDVSASYTLSCQALPERLTLQLWQHYPRLNKLTVNLALASGQSRQTLRRGEALALKGK